MAKTTTKKPNIEKFANKWRDSAEKYINDEIRPYLQQLLNIAQRKLRSKISFRQGMGIYALNLDCSNRVNGNFEDFDDVLENDIMLFHDAVVARFPELVEFLKIINNAMEEFGEGLGQIGGIAPTVPPRRLISKLLSDITIGESLDIRGMKVERTSRDVFRIDSVEHRFLTTACVVVERWVGAKVG